MQIKAITIQGEAGDIEIKRVERGALVIANDIEVLVENTASREDLYGIAWNAAKVIWGTTKRGEPKATNSMIHDVLNEIERVAV